MNKSIIHKYLFAIAFVLSGISCGHDLIEVYDESGLDLAPFPDLVLYDGPVATDSAEDIPDLSDRDTYWEAAGFDNHIVVTYSEEGASVEGAPWVKKDIQGGDVCLDIGGNKGIEIVIRGCNDDGSLTIYGSKKFKLTFSGLDLRSSKGAVINIQCPKRVFAHLTEGTVNRIVDAPVYIKKADEDMKGCFFAEGDIIFSGSGILLVEATGSNGIVSDDGIVIRPGITISSTVSSMAGKAIKAKEILDVRGGALFLGTSGDGYYDEVEMDDKSAVCLASDSTIFLRGGRIEAHSTGIAGKGIKADGSIFIGADDTPGPNILISTSGEKLIGENYSSSPKGIKSGNRIEFRSGRLNIPECSSEGLESKNASPGSILISGGEISIKAADDGINSAGGIQIEGGKVFVWSTGNDGIDSNFHGEGCFDLRGGLVLALTSLERHDCGIDTDKAPLRISGGTLFTCGRYQGTGPSAPKEETAIQPTTLVSKIDLVQDEFVAVYDSNMQPIFAFLMPFSFTEDYSIITCPDFVVGSKYTVRTGGYTPTTGSSWNGYWEGGDPQCTTRVKTLDFSQNYLKR